MNQIGSVYSKIKIEFKTELFSVFKIKPQQNRWFRAGLKNISFPHNKYSCGYESASHKIDILNYLKKYVEFRII